MKKICGAMIVLCLYSALIGAMEVSMSPEIVVQNSDERTVSFLTLLKRSHSAPCMPSVPQSPAPKQYWRTDSLTIVDNEIEENIFFPETFNGPKAPKGHWNVGEGIKNAQRQEPVQILVQLWISQAVALAMNKKS